MPYSVSWFVILLGLVVTIVTPTNRVKVTSFQQSQHLEGFCAKQIGT